MRFKGMVSQIALAAALMLAGAGTAAAAAAEAAEAAAEEANQLLVQRIAAGTGPVLDPGAALWRKAPVLSVPLQAQMIATPVNSEPAVSSMTVRAVHDGLWITFQLRWDDPTKSDVVDLDHFGDQVAVELPVKAYDAGNPPNPMMGDAEQPVSIMQWRAVLQRDQEKGEPKLSDIYPNAHVDFYTADLLKPEEARAYTGAVGLGNPVSRVGKSPVLDQMAAGFGSLTIKPEQRAGAKGVWADGHWTVVVARPMKVVGAYDPKLVPGDDGVAAFAVWDGGKDETGSRKAWSDWVPLHIEK